MKRASAAAVFGCASVLLGYPGDGFEQDLDAVTEAAARMPPGPVRSRLLDTAAWLRGQPVMDTAATYVETFDLRRGCSLYLTYYRHGDTRDRGLALSALVDAYRAAGFAVTPSELPDYLPALLELAAVHRDGSALLAEHRMALEALRSDLESAGSPYAPVVASVLDVLSGPTRADREALRRYRAQGPPSEQVGLEPFAPPETIGPVVRR